MMKKWIKAILIIGIIALAVVIFILLIPKMPEDLQRFFYNLQETFEEFWYDLFHGGVL